MLFDGEYNYVVVSNDEWEKLRNEYISNLKNGIKYELKEINNLIITDDSFNKKDATIVDKLFDLVGEDVVEFK
jgi:hypothetical protein